MTLYCPQCLDVMKPLFTGHFCPNECDRLPKKSAQNNCMSAWIQVSHKMPIHLVSQLEQICYKSRKVCIWKEHNGPWGAAPRDMTHDELLTAEVAIVLTSSGAMVIKNRYGDYTIEGLQLS